MGRKLLFFSPFSDIWEHAYPEAIVAQSFLTSGWEVEYLTCGGAFVAHCSSMAAKGITEFDSETKRLEICNSCHLKRDLLSSSFEFKARNIESLLSTTDETRIQDILTKVTNVNWTDLQIDGLPLGRFAIYETWLNHKLVDTRLSDEMFQAYLGQLKNTLRAYFAAKAYFATNSVDAVIVYNDHYSVNNAVCAAAVNASIPAYDIHAGRNIRKMADTLSLRRARASFAHSFNSPGWKSFSQQPITAKEVELVSQHFQGLWEAKSVFVYSGALQGTNATTLRSNLGIEENRKVLLAPMSSEDEILALKLIDCAPETSIKNSLFQSQLEWIQFLLEFAKKNNELHLIIRLHPRMFPNKREQVLSPVAQEIMALRDTAPANVTFNSPDQDIGLYDLAQITNVVLNFKSSVGAELLALGIPVVVPANSDFFSYPNELNQIAYSTAEYEDLIHNAIKDGWSIENSKRAFRWFAFLFGRLAADISGNTRIRPSAIGLHKNAFMYRIWQKCLSILIRFFPLMREKSSLRRIDFPTQSSLIFHDVITNGLENISDSKLWTREASSDSQETAAISAFFESVLRNEWSNVLETNSLAGIIRSHLSHS